MDIKKKYLGFMDETGVLHQESNQRFFALGLLKIADTSTLSDALQRLKNRSQDMLRKEAIQKGYTPSSNQFEFKFNSITKSSYKMYYELIDLFFSFSNLSFSCLIFDKMNNHINIPAYFNNIWDAYIAYSKLLIKNNVNITNGESICIIADYLGKPKESPLFFEKEVGELEGVYNVCMLESHAALFIQLVDVLIGCIAFDYKIFRGQTKQIDEYKMNVCLFLKKKLDKNSLEGNFTIQDPCYFNVWEFKKDGK